MIYKKSGQSAGDSLLVSLSMLEDNKNDKQLYSFDVIHLNIILLSRAVTRSVYNIGNKPCGKHAMVHQKVHRKVHRNRWNTGRCFDRFRVRSTEKIWNVDDDYDGSNFIVKQIFFCGGDKDEFDKWRKGLSDMAKQSTKQKAEATLKIEIDDEAFGHLYGHISHPIELKKKGHKIAVRVVSQFGEESTKVLEI